MHEAILVVEDNAIVLENNCDFLAEQGYAAAGATTLAEARQLLQGTSFALVLLDINLPDGEGFALEEDIPAQTAILYLTGRVDEEDVVRGLSREGGRVDYLRKPFTYPEMGARVRALLATAKQQTADDWIATGPLTIDRVSGRAFLAGKDLLLSPKELALLLYMMKNSGKRLTAADMYRAVWHEETNDLRTMRVRLSNLRKKLNTDPEHPVSIVLEERAYYRLVVGSKDT